MTFYQYHRFSKWLIRRLSIIVVFSKPAYSINHFFLFLTVPLEWTENRKVLEKLKLLVISNCLGKFLQSYWVMPLPEVSKILSQGSAIFKLMLDGRCLCHMVLKHELNRNFWDNLWDFHDTDFETMKKVKITGGEVGSFKKKGMDWNRGFQTFQKKWMDKRTQGE